MMKTMKLLKYILLTTLALTACKDNSIHQGVHQPSSFDASNECHVCGMVITQFPGPKGQAFGVRSEQERKFCSTIELVFWYLQPENKPNVKEMYVHDMTKTEWNKPNDNHLTDARKAFFVLGSSQKGSMGSTLASFSQKQPAIQFTEKWGGKVVAFDELSISALTAPH